MYSILADSCLISLLEHNVAQYSQDEQKREEFGALRTVVTEGRHARWTFRTDAKNQWAWFSPFSLREIVTTDGLVRA